MNAKRKDQFGRLMLIAGLGFVAAGGVVLFQNWPKWYVAIARVYVVPKPIEGPYAWNLFFFGKECELIQSPTVLSNALASLARQPRTGPHLDSIKELGSEAALKKLRRLVNVAPVRSTALVEIRVSYDEPDAAAQIANAIAKAYCELPAERQRRFTQAELATIESLLRDEAVGGNPSAELPIEYQRRLLAAQQGRAIGLAQTELIEAATPPALRVSLRHSLDELLGRIPYPFPGPPPHPFSAVCLGLVSLGAGLVVLGWHLMKQRTI